MAKKKSFPKKKNELSTEIFHKNDHIMDNYQGESCCQVKNFKLIADLIPDLTSFCYPIEIGHTLDIELKRFKNILIYEDYMKGECDHFEGYLSEDTEYTHTCENNNEKIGDLPIEELMKVHQMICDGKMNPTTLTSYQYFKVMMHMKEKQPKVKVGPKSYKEKMNRKAIRKSPRGKIDEIKENETEPTEEPVRYNLRQTRNSKRASQELNIIDDSALIFTRKKRKKPDITQQIETPNEVEPIKEVTAPVTEIHPETLVQQIKTPIIPDSPESPDNQGTSEEIIITSLSPESPPPEIPASQKISISSAKPDISPESPPLEPIKPTEVKPSEIPSPKISISSTKPSLLKHPEILTIDDEKENQSDDEIIPETPPLVRRLASRDPRLQKRIEEQRIFEDKKLVADKIIESYHKEKQIKEEYDRLERQKMELKRKEEELNRKLDEDMKIREEEQKRKKKKTVDIELIYKTPLSDLHSEEKISYNNHKPRTEDTKNEPHKHKPRIEDTKNEPYYEDKSKYYSNISYNSHTEHSQILNQQIHFHIHSKVRDYQYTTEFPNEEQPVRNLNKYYSKPFRRRYEIFQRRSRVRNHQDKRYSDHCFRRRNKDTRRY